MSHRLTSEAIETEGALRAVASLHQPSASSTNASACGAWISEIPPGSQTVLI